jgi:hypothetical protein
MSNILDLRTVGNNTIYVVDGKPNLGTCADPVSALGTPAFIGSIAMFDGDAEPEVSRATFLQLGSFYDVVGAGKAVQLYDGTNTGFYFWFNVTDGTNTQTDPSLVGTGTQVDILVADTPAQIAVKFAAAVDSLPEFVSPVPPSNVASITNAVGGIATDISVTGTAATVVVMAQGVAKGSVGHCYLKIGAADDAWTEISTTDSQSLVKSGDFRKVALYSIDATGATLDDSVDINTHPVDVIIRDQPTRAVGIEYTIPNPGDNIPTADFVLTEGDQTIYGDKTFGTSIRPADIRMYGTLQVDGTLTYINTTDLNVTDKLITLNKGGAGSSAGGSGIEFEEAGNPTGYIKLNTAENGFLFQAPVTSAAGYPVSSYGEFLFSALTTDRTYTWQNLSGVVALQTAGTKVDKQVAYYDSTLRLECESGVTNDAFTWDYSTNMLGIRTNAPARPLDVNGSSIFRGALKIEQPTSLVNYEIVQASIPTTSATPVVLQTIGTASGTVMLVEARVLAKRTAGGVAGSCATYIRTFRVKNVGGTVSIYNVDSMYTSEDVTAWNVTVVVNGTDIEINAVGAASTSITWNATTMIQIL